MLEYFDMKEYSVEKTIRIISGKWTTTILYQLTFGKKRFGELQRLLSGISSKTLTHRLRMLEKNGIIKKTVFPEIPLHVEYELTEKGSKLNTIFSAMDDWGKNL